jgi:hypothetical protein
MICFVFVYTASALLRMHLRKARLLLAQYAAFGTYAFEGIRCH